MSHNTGLLKSWNLKTTPDGSLTRLGLQILSWQRATQRGHPQKVSRASEPPACHLPPPPQFPLYPFQSLPTKTAYLALNEQQMKKSHQWG